MARKITVEFICILFIFLFVYAAISKLIDFQKFHIQISQSPLLTKYSVFIAWFIPIIELATAALLLFDRTRLIGLYAGFSLMTMFTVYIVVVSQFSEHVPCSCGGVIENLTWTEHLIFNVVFMIGGVLGALLFYSPTPERVHLP